MPIFSIAFEWRLNFKASFRLVAGSRFLRMASHTRLTVVLRQNPSHAGIFFLLPRSKILKEYLSNLGCYDVAVELTSSMIVEALSSRMSRTAMMFPEGPGRQAARLRIEIFYGQDEGPSLPERSDERFFGKVTG